MNFRSMFACALSAVTVLVSSVALATNVNYTDSSKINVLRKYGGLTAVNQVTQAVSGNIFRLGAGDGGGWNDEMNSGSPSDTFTHTWFLPTPVSIGSWNAQMNTAPGQMAIEYSTNGGGTWNPWNTQVFTPGSTVANSTFTASTVNNVNAIRYVATAGATQTFRIDEVQVFMPGSLSISLAEGYNSFTQNIVSSQLTSTTSGAWKAPNGGNAAMMHNGIVRFDNELKNQDPTGTTRSFVEYTLNDATGIASATLGGTNGQGWQGNWELYTANGTPTNPQTLGNSISALQAGGWTLQHSYTLGTPVGGAPAYDFLLSNPGQWTNALLVFDSQFGAMQELELHTNSNFLPPPPAPEPASFALLACGALVLFRRRM